MTHWDQESVTDLVGNNSDLTYDNVLQITGLPAATLNTYLSQSSIGLYVLSRD